jgi:GNAT superfamily N-acetyltransferase
MAGGGHDGAMAWTITGSLDDFTAAADPFLRARPEENTVALTVCATLRRQGLETYGGAPVFGWWRDGAGEVAASFLQTPPFPPLLAHGTPESARELAAELPASVPGARGVAESVRAFAAAWRERTGGQARVDREMRLFRLGTLLPPDPAPCGRARLAGPEDRALLEEWAAAFSRDLGEESPSNAVRAVADSLALGGRYLWEDGGRPVAMAGTTPPEEGQVRIVAVYTPEAERGRGYGAGVTHAVTRAALDAGAKDVLLFTDLANPVSNRLYPRLGYRPLSDQLSVVFTPPVS